MPTEYTPTRLARWTMPRNYHGEVWPDYYSSGFGRSRDSDDLEESNFHCALAALGGESETVLVIRESHWAVGWVEWIAIHATDYAALRVADALRERIDAYPVLNEGDWSEREQESAATIWRDCYTWRERADYIRRHRSQFEPRDFRDLMGCARGEYFLGYASELVS